MNTTLKLKESTYVAIKVKDLPHWLWFEMEKTSRDSGMFRGEGGWGAGGAHTEILVSEDLIEGEITSTELQYAESQ